MIHPFYIMLLICIIWICLSLSLLVYLSWKRNGMLAKKKSKRKPIEIWVNLYDTGIHYAYDREKDALINRAELRCIRTAKFREVTDE